MAVVKTFLSLFALSCFVFSALTPVAATYISKLYPKVFITSDGSMDPGLGITAFLFFFLLCAIGSVTIETASKIK